MLVAARLDLVPHIWRAATWRAYGLRVEVARPVGFEPPTLCLEVVGFQNLNALSSVAYGRKLFWDLSSVGLRGLQRHAYYKFLKLKLLVPIGFFLATCSTFR